MTQPRSPGRPKGSRNQITMTVKRAIEAAFEGIGGVENLTAWAREHPTDFFKLYVKLLPIDVRAELKHSGAVTIIVETGVPRAPDEPMVEAA